MAKITPKESGPQGTKVITVKTKSEKSKPAQGYQWWKAKTKDELSEQILSTAAFLKERQGGAQRQAGIFARLYGGSPLFNFMGSNLNKGTSSQSLPADRPTMNVIQSCIDTLGSRIAQSKPRPMFLTDGGDYKERNFAKLMNKFTMGEFYQTDAYALGELVLRDAAVLGTGVIKIFEDLNKRVGLERVLKTELYVDPNDAMYGDPRQLYQLKLVDRSVLSEMFPKYRSDIQKAEQAFPDNSDDSSKTIADQVMVVEAWRLPSSKTSNDGRHSIVCTEGAILDEEYKKQRFPFTFLHYSPRLLGFWGQGLSEQLMGTQVEINKLLMTISSAINLVGVPRVFVEKGSKVVKAHINNQVGAIVEYTGMKPIYEVAPCMPQEVYAQLQRLVEYAYQQSGVSALSATSQKPAGLNSGEAIRNYDDLQSDRFASLQKRYENFYIDLAYQITDLAKDIAEREGSYQTIYPNKDGAKEIKLPDVKKLEDPFVIQCFDVSSLPRDPSGRLQKVTEMAQAGMISLQEARRLLDYPDLEQNEKLANAAEERILQMLDSVVEDGKDAVADEFLDLKLANQLTIQYINLYSGMKLEEAKMEKLRSFLTQVQQKMKDAMAPAMGALGAGTPQAVPEATPTSPLLPNAPQAAAMQ